MTLRKKTCESKAAEGQSHSSAAAEEDGHVDGWVFGYKKQMTCFWNDAESGFPLGHEGETTSSLPSNDGHNLAQSKSS